MTERMERDHRLRAYIKAVLALGFVVFTISAVAARFSPGYSLIAYLFTTVVLSMVKIKLPGLTTNLSLNTIPILVGIAELTAAESVLLASTGTLIQCIWHAKKKPRLLQMAFNIAVDSIAVTSSGTLYHAMQGWPVSAAIGFGTLAVTYFTMNSLPVCTAIALSERKSLIEVWRDCYASFFPPFMVAATISGIFLASKDSEWVLSLGLFPLSYLVYKAYWIFLARLDHEKSNASESAALNLRAIETFVAVISARDGENHDSDRLVQTLAIEVAKQLGLAENEVKAVAAAALLRDIGKIAVPDYLLSKAGQLTPAEVEKVRSHASLGAEILERVNFPFPVVPIVRGHHERWDGTGYPDGLKGEEIPLGARILVAVDTLVALGSERSHRPAMNIDEAMAKIGSEAGKGFDPNVVAALKITYAELGSQLPVPASARQNNVNSPSLLPDSSVQGSTASQHTRKDPLQSIAAARYEDQVLAPSDRFLTLQESLSVFAIRLNRVVRYDTLVIHLQVGNALTPEYACGDEAKLFTSGNVTVGQGVSGWVAAHGKSLLNGEPAKEVLALGVLLQQTKMRSAVSVPLESALGRRGVVTLYRSERNAFTFEEMRILLAVRLRILDSELQPLASAAILSSLNSADQEESVPNSTCTASV